MTTRQATVRYLASIILFIVIFQLIRLDLLAAENDKTKLKDKMRSLMQGIALGKNTRVFPYASLDDWFDPYGGLLLQHPGFRSSEDRIAHHIKFEAARDFSWKIRYLANSLSSDRTHLQFLLKTKLDRDPFFYGLGNATIKENRIRATYTSIFVGAEIAQQIGSHFLYTWSPGVWHFKSGLEAGGEFEKVSSAFYITSRFSISDKTRLDYKRKSFTNYWSSYIEVGLPANSVAWYARINFETITRIPLFKNHKFTFGNRIEFLVSEDKNSVPYFAMPETGSRSGLRGFAKERFRDFALSLFHFEYSVPLTDDFEGFVLTDIAKTSSKFQLFPGENSHVATGFGLRFLNKNNPISVGIAKSNEGWKVFSAIATGKPW